MKKHSTILGQFVEDISGRIMESYPATVRKMIHGRSGVYVLYRRERLYYVGLASNLRSRLKGHLKDRHRGLWDRFSVYLTNDAAHIRELEALLLRISKPTGNRVKGRLKGATSLYSTLSREMALIDERRRANLLGGSVAKRLRRRQASSARGAEALASIADRRLQLRGIHKDRRFRATLRRDGTVGFNGRVYDSPTAAARTAVGRSVNGWWFWHFKQGTKWVRLASLKR
jgi:hypothetical protein